MIKNELFHEEYIPLKSIAGGELGFRIQYDSILSLCIIKFCI